MKKLAAFALVLASPLAFLEQAPAAVVYRSGEGWSAEGAEGITVESNAGAQQSKAEGLEADGNTKGALDAYRGLVRKFPESRLAAGAQLKVGELAEALGDYERAFEAYGRYVTKYPRGDKFNQAVEGQFRIARLFLEGERRRVLGVKTFGSMDRAREMFEEILKNAPFSKFAPMAQFSIGQAAEKQGDIAKAVEAYQNVIVKYPNDPIAADAQYQIGYVYFVQARDRSYDPGTVTKAREAFEDFIARYPESEKVNQAQENLKSLETKRTSDSLSVARFYDKKKDYKAAVIYYNIVLKEQPGSADAEAAKIRIGELKESVGEDALRPGPERTETGERAQIRRKLQAQVDTAARADFAGPPVSVPDEVPAPKPKPRTSSENLGPVPAVEPALPE